MVSIDGLDRADVLCALYNASRPLGLGVMHYTPQGMSREEAKALLDERDYFDYLKGRVMKVRLTKGATEIDEWLYDRDNGAGAMDRAVQRLRSHQAD